MGLTIHYELKTKGGIKNVREFLKALREKAMDLPFKEVGEVIELKGDACNYNNVTEDDLRWMLIQATQTVPDPAIEGRSHQILPNHVIAFITWPGPGCEAANFGLCQYPGSIVIPYKQDLWGISSTKRIRTGFAGKWCWQSFCKTQYASDPRCGGVEHFLRCHLMVVKMLDHAKSLGILSSVSDEGEYWERRSLEALAVQVGEWNGMIAKFAGQLKDQLGEDQEMVAPITKYPNFEHLEANQ